MTVRYWTTSELAVLRNHYPTGGYKACIERLPHRSRTAICQQAAKQGVRSAENELEKEKSWPQNLRQNQKNGRGRYGEGKKHQARPIQE